MSSGVKCPDCGEPVSRNLETRISGGGVRRRRVCAGCGRRFTTHEMLAGHESPAERRLRAVIRATRGHYDHDTEA